MDVWPSAERDSLTLAGDPHQNIEGTFQIRWAAISREFKSQKTPTCTLALHTSDSDALVSSKSQKLYLMRELPAVSYTLTFKKNSDEQEEGSKG